MLDIMGKMDITPRSPINYSFLTHLYTIYHVFATDLLILSAKGSFKQ